MSVGNYTAKPTYALRASRQLVIEDASTQQPVKFSQLCSQYYYYNAGAIASVHGA